MLSQPHRLHRTTLVTEVHTTDTEVEKINLFLVDSAAVCADVQKGCATLADDGAGDVTEAPIHQTMGGMHAGEQEYRCRSSECGGKMFVKDADIFDTTLNRMLTASPTLRRNIHAALCTAGIITSEPGAHQVRLVECLFEFKHPVGGHSGPSATAEMAGIRKGVDRESSAAEVQRPAKFRATSSARSGK